MCSCDVVCVGVCVLVCLCVVCWIYCVMLDGLTFVLFLPDVVWLVF